MNKFGVKCGDQTFLDLVREAFMNGQRGEGVFFFTATKDEYADALKAFQQQTDEIKSVARDAAIHVYESMKRDEERIWMLVLAKISLNSIFCEKNRFVSFFLLH